MNPEDAAAAMTNPDGSVDMDTEPVEGGTEAETPTPEAGEGGSSGGLFDKLLSAEPSPQLGDVEDPWNPEQGGTTRIYRGVQKLGDIEGMPAALDIIIGVAEFVSQLEETDSETESETDSEKQTLDNPVGSPA